LGTTVFATIQRRAYDGDLVPTGEVKPEVRG
jgi:hypothetical protein